MRYTISTTLHYTLTTANEEQNEVRLLLFFQKCKTYISQKHPIKTDINVIHTTTMNEPF